MEGALVVATGNDRGFIRPCGCSRPKLGGITRRAAAIEDLRKRRPSFSLVSLGDMVVAGGRQQQIKFETFLGAMEEMGYEVFVPGRGELLLGGDYLVEAARELTGIPFLGLNLRRNGRRVFAAHRKLSSSGFLAVGLMEEGETPSDLEIRPPAAELRAWLEERRSLEPLLVLFSGGREGARRVAEALPAGWKEEAFVVFGGTFDQPAQVDDVAGVRVASVGSKGRHLPVFALGSRFNMEIVTLREELPEDETAAEILQGYRDLVREEKLLERWPRREPVAAYVGDEACGACHGEIKDLMDATAHARAFRALAATGDQHDPECVRCHVTGFGERGGFVTPETTPDLADVTCEACHGPGGNHVEDQGPLPIRGLGQRLCIRCHDPDNSTHFSFPEYWKKIRHP